METLIIGSAPVHGESWLQLSLSKSCDVGWEAFSYIDIQGSLPNMIFFFAFLLGVVKRVTLDPFSLVSPFYGIDANASLHPFLGW